MGMRSHIPGKALPKLGHLSGQRSMTAAVRSRAASATAPKQSARSGVKSNHDYDDVAVLLRLPDLEQSERKPPVSERRDTASSDRPHAGDSQSDVTTAAAQDDATPRESQGHPIAPAPKFRLSTSKLLAFAWRLGVVLAALGLVVLAYRIINGPPTSADDPSHITPGDNLSDAEGGESGETASGDEKTLSARELSPPPTIVTPQVATPAPDSPPAADDLSAENNDALADDRFDRSPEALLAPETHLPIGAAERQPKDAGRAVADGANARGAPANPVQEHSDGDDHPFNERNAWGPNNPESSHEHPPNAAATYQGVRNEAEYDYPVTDPSTWRTPEEWNAVPAAAENGAPPPSSWDENSRSAARLRPEIAQPPLHRNDLHRRDSHRNDPRRNDEPNRSSLY